MADGNRKPKARMLDGKLVALQAITPMAEADREAEAKAFRERMRAVCRGKRKESETGRLEIKPGKAI